MAFTRFPSITPLPGASDGTLQGWPKLGSDSAKHWQDHGRPRSRSYSRNRQGCLELEAAEEQAFQDAEEPQEQHQRGVQTVDPLADRRQELRREQGKDRFHRRIRKCNPPVRQDQSRLSRKHDALETFLEAG